jgi:TRAP-type uncharacterized transport system fused permease subunit
MFLPPETGPVTFCLMVLFGLYLLYEVWRWVTGNRALLTPGQFRRRMIGGILLELDLLLWFLANPLMKDRPNREKLLYMLVAMLLVFIPMLLAVREAAFVMRQYTRWRGEMVRNLGKREGQEEKE